MRIAVIAVWVVIGEKPPIQIIVHEDLKDSPYLKTQPCIYNKQLL